MTRDIYYVEVDRVVVTGAGSEPVDASEVRALVETAVAREVASATLPAGRTMRASVEVNAPTLAGAPAIANAVAAGLTRATGGGR